MPERQGLIPLRERVRQLDRIYGVAERAIKEEFLMIDVGNYKELKAIETQERINGIIAMLNRAAIKWSKSAVPEAYEKSYRISKTRLEILGAQTDPGFSEKTHKQTIDEEIDITMDVLIRGNQSIKVNVATFLYLSRVAARGLSQFQAFDMRDEEFIGSLVDDLLREGGTRGEAKRLILEHFRKQFGDAQFISINGRNYNLRKYADLVAKVRLRTVQTEAVLNSCKEYDNDLVEVSDHGSEFVDICLEYEGNVYSLSGKSNVYPFLPEYPPFHPRCQHHIRPTSEAALDWRKSNA